MRLFFALAAATGLASYALISVLDSKAANAKPKGCRIPTEQAIFQANQAFLSGDPQMIQAVMTIFENYGCTAEAQAMRDWITQHGYSPNIPIVQTNVPMPTAGPGQVSLQAGETWRAAALLGGIGCAVGLDTIRDKITAKGFSSVSVWSKNPGWGSQWDADAGFLECTRYIQATVAGKNRVEKKPSQIYKLERVSVAT